MSTVPTHRDPLDDALAALAGSDGLADPGRLLGLLDGRLASALVSETAAHRLDAAFHDALERAGQPVPAATSDTVKDDRITRLKVGAVLQRLAPRLDDAGIVWLTMKGPTVSSLMRRSQLRSFNDLDLLVDAAQLEEAIAVLVDAGAHDLNQNWRPYLRHRVGEVPLEAGGISVDLHWHVVGLKHHRRACRLDPTAMLHRRRLRQIGDRRVPVLDAEDQLIHLAVHAAMSGATRLDQLRDLSVVIEADPVDWSVLEARANEARVARLVAHGLERARRILGANVDIDVVHRLGGSALVRQSRRDSDRVRGLRAFAVATSRDSRHQSAHAKAVRLAGYGAERVNLHRGWDFTEPRSRLYFANVSGGESARRQFLAGVVDWA